LKHVVPALSRDLSVSDIALIAALQLLDFCQQELRPPVSTAAGGYGSRLKAGTTRQLNTLSSAAL